MPETTALQRAILLLSLKRSTRPSRRPFFEHNDNHHRNRGASSHNRAHIVNGCKLTRQAVLYIPRRMRLFVDFNKCIIIKLHVTEDGGRHQASCCYLSHASIFSNVYGRLVMYFSISFTEYKNE